jgi:hypothetical protein
VATVSWASSTNVNAVAITAPVSTDTPAVQVFSGISTGVTVTGTVTDSGNTGLAYKTVTLTGDQGVYFSTSSTGTSLVNSLDVTTNGSGTFTAYAFYTKTGNAKITATSGSKSSQVTVAVQKPGNTERYMVSLNDVSALPGSTVVVSGKVVDVFGNPVPGVTPAQLTLTGDTVSLGVLGTQSTTNNGGEFSATFIAGSTPGKVYLSAEIWGGVQQSPDAGWLTTGGLTLPKSNSVATATLTIAPDSVSLNASSASVVGAKGITLSGTTRPNTAVDVYLKNTGAPLALIDSVTSGNDGKFSVPVTVTRNSTFVAKTATATSSAVTVKVTSTATISSSIRKGKLRVTVAGGPSRSGTVQLWERLRGGKLVEVGKPVYTRYGAVTWTFKASNGTRIFRAQYTASGSQPSAIVSTQVTQLAPRRR